MDCPVCRKPLVTLEYQHFEVDYCLGCEGIWLDGGELEALYGGPVVLLRAPSPGGRLRRGDARRCPLCRRGMRRVTVPGDPPLVFDQCPRGEGLWFDRGELEAVLERGHPADPDGTLSAWLREVFRPRGGEVQP